ncbi:MAG: flagellar motor protein MotA [Defluviicoccus sp.]|nr:flagellar motor protein MotA [Defluviicoccus sp.]
MTKPGRYLLRMGLFILAVAGAASWLSPTLVAAFLVSPVLNGLILSVLVFGIVYNLRQVARLWPEVEWLKQYRGEPTGKAIADPPRLLAPMATMIGARKGRLTLSAPALRTLLDGIASRLDESRDISRYTVGLLIFLGLLGTFWGLLQTVNAIGAVIGGLSFESGDVAGVFAELKRGLEAPIGGMGTAFSSSMFGLGGSLILGFLELQTSQAQNRFYNELEEWLSGLTRISSGGALATDVDQPVSAYVQALLEQTAEGLDGLQQLLRHWEEGRIAANTQLIALIEKIEGLADHMRTDQAVMMRLVETQNELKPLLLRLGETIEQRGTDDVLRAHTRNLELYAARLLDEMTTGRAEFIRQVRGDIKLLARTLAAATGREPPHEPGRER